MLCPYFLFWHFLANSAPASSWPEVWGWCSVSGWFVNRGNTKHKMWTSYHQNMNRYLSPRLSVVWLLWSSDHRQQQNTIQIQQLHHLWRRLRSNQVASYPRLPRPRLVVHQTAMYWSSSAGGELATLCVFVESSGPAPGREQTSSCCHFILAPHHRSSRYVDRW